MQKAEQKHFTPGVTSSFFFSLFFFAFIMLTSVLFVVSVSLGIVLSGFLFLRNLSGGTLSGISGGTLSGFSGELLVLDIFGA